MKIQTAKLTVCQINYLVAGLEEQAIWWNADEEVYEYRDREEDGDRTWSPATDWALGGPIIEREKIRVGPYGAADLWIAGNAKAADLGPTPLIAATRCFVASRLGDEVEIPEDIL